MMPKSFVPSLRVRVVNDVPANEQRRGQYVLYWMTAFRRGTSNFALQRAVELGQEHNCPVLVFEALRVGYRWANDRLHHFVIQGMADNQAFFAKRGTTYYPYIEKSPGDGAGLLAALAESAVAVVGDDFPCFFLPAMTRTAARQIKGRFELVDSNGLLPMRAADKVFVRAHYFRRFLHKNLRPHLEDVPDTDPLSRSTCTQAAEVPPPIAERWPSAEVDKLAQDTGLLSSFPIDHNVRPSEIKGGVRAAQTLLKQFVRQRLDAYDVDRNHPDSNGSSGFSPYLHFGHLSSHEVFSAVMKADGWQLEDISDKPTGSREGWWNASPFVEAFLDEFITWRELGYNMCWQQADYDRYESLPEWAQKTLHEHERDPREHLYSLEEFEQSQTHDELWNAAQRQLVLEGRIHNYLRMLWGKKILQWTPDARTALAVMIELNNKYALDGRNPNSYSGIFWVLGRYDRAWGPERKIFGKVRYMTSDNTARKVRLKHYLKKYGELP